MTRWRVVPLRAIYQRIELRGRAELPLLSVYRDHGVVPRDERDDNNNRPSEDLSTYKYVRPGDLVVNKMKTWQGSLAVSGYEGIVSPAYFVGRRVSDVDDRFMHHLLRSMPMIAQYGARSKGSRPSQWDLPWDEFAAIKVLLPRVGEPPETSLGSVPFSGVICLVFLCDGLWL
jgi:type I restriction enzyme S subunit